MQLCFTCTVCGLSAAVKAQLEKLVEKNYHLNMSARDAYRSYLQAYASHSLKDVFNVNTLDLQLVAKAVGLQVPPRVQLNFSASMRGDKKQRKKGGGKGGKGGKGDGWQVCADFDCSMLIAKCTF